MKEEKETYTNGTDGSFGIIEDNEMEEFNEFQRFKKERQAKERLEKERKLKETTFNFFGVKLSTEKVYTTQDVTDIVHKLNKRIAMYYAPALSVGEITSTDFRLQEKLVPRSRQDFINEFEHKVILVEDKGGKIKGQEIARLWLKHKDKRAFGKDSVFLPGKAPMSMVDGKFNTWAGWAAAPVKGNKHVRVLQFLKHHITAKEGHAGFKYLINKLACMVQYPLEKSWVATCLVSTENGTGKSIVTDLILRGLVGRHYKPFDKLSKLMNDFNGALADKQVVVLEEVGLKFNPAAVEFMKNFLTKQTMAIQRKFQETQDEENVYFNVWIATNHTMLDLDPSDRRYSIFEATKNGWEDQDYRDFCRWFKSDPEIMDNLLWYLMNVKADLDMSNTVFDSEIRRQSLETSKPIVDQFFDHYFWAICSGDYKVKFSTFFEDTYDLNAIKAFHVETLLKDFLKQEGYKPKNEKITTLGIGKRIAKDWVVGNPRCPQSATFIRSKRSGKTYNLSLKYKKGLAGGSEVEDF